MHCTAFLPFAICSRLPLLCYSLAKFLSCLFDGGVYGMYGATMRTIVPFRLRDTIRRPYGSPA
jgi:hypothetical protein